MGRKGKNAGRERRKTNRKKAQNGKAEGYGSLCTQYSF